MKHTRVLAWLAAGLLPLGGGCADGWRWPGWDRQAKDTDGAAESSVVFKDSIAEVASFEGLRRMHVQGYGVVGGLGPNGSTECPREVRDRLVSQMAKRPEFLRASTRRQGITPGRLIDDPDTGVVLVQGEIPAGAVAGSRFDVSVSAVPGTQTTSLRGGQLLPCDLNVVRMLTPAAGIAGQALAEAAGPIFMNPFSDRPGAATKSASRVGTLIGGGVVSTDRRIRLVLFRPSYSLAVRIASVINARFPSPRKLADPVSPSYVKLAVPPEFAEDPGHFLAVVRHLYLNRRPGFVTTRARQLAEEITKENPAYESIALAWEGLGKRVLPMVGKLYSHQNRLVGYYAALAGLRLGDDLAVDVIAEHAADSHSPVRFAAIDELGQANDVPRAVRPLRQLLDDGDPFVRVAAYEALLNWGGPAITTRMVGKDNFVLDLVASSGERLIYAKRTGSRRIAIFGKGVTCVPPLIYRHPSGDLAINAYENDTQLTVLRRLPHSETVGPPVTLGFDVVELIARLGSDPTRRHRLETGATGTQAGLGVDYGAVIQALHELCDMRSINARFLMETKSITELFGPSPPAGRPESELE